MAVFSTNEDMVQALYVAYFGRAGEPRGVTYWTGKLDTGAMQWSQVAAAFSVQAEATAKYPFLAEQNDNRGDENSARDFVVSVYEGLFGRAPDPGGLKHWVDLLLGRGGDVLPGYKLILDIVSGVPLGSSDHKSIENKVAVARYFTNVIAAKGKEFDLATKEVAQQVIAGTTAEASTVRIQEAAIDAI